MEREKPRERDIDKATQWAPRLLLTQRGEKTERSIAFPLRDVMDSKPS